MFTKLLELLLMLIPLIVEAFSHKRSEDETAKEYVRRQQKEKLKTYEALNKDTGEAITKLSWDRIHRALLLKIRKDDAR